MNHPIWDIPIFLSQNFIYKNHYFNKDTEITKSLIGTRLNNWLKSTDYTILPVSFLFNNILSLSIRF